MNGESYIYEHGAFKAHIVHQENEELYWERLRHQAALAAMSATMHNTIFAAELRKADNNGIGDMSKIVTKAAVIYADALIEKLKEGQ